MGLLRSLKLKFFSKFGRKEKEDFEYDDPYSLSQSGSPHLSEGTGTSEDNFVFADDDGASEAMVVWAGVLAAWWVAEGMDTRLRDLQLMQAQLRQAQDTRKGELAMVKQSLSHVDHTSRELLTYIVSQAEEDIGITHANPTHPPPLHQRLARVNNAAQIEKDKEKTAQFSKITRKRSVRGHARNSKLASWKENVDEKKEDDMFVSGGVHLQTREPPALRRNPYNPRFDTFPATANIEQIQTTAAAEVPRGVSFPSPSRLRPVGIRGDRPIPHTILIVKHGTWSDVIDVNEQARKKVIALEDLGITGDGMWLPNGRLRLEAKGELVIPELLATAKNKGYLVWDNNGVFRGLHVHEEDDTESESDEGVVPSEAYQAPLTILATNPVTTFHMISKVLVSAGYYPSSVTPTAPLTYNVLFRPPIPTASDLMPLCQTHHWKMQCLSIGGKAY